MRTTVSARRQEDLILSRNIPGFVELFPETHARSSVRRVADSEHAALIAFQSENAGDTSCGEGVHISTTDNLFPARIRLPSLRLSALLDVHRSPHLGNIVAASYGDGTLNRYWTGGDSSITFQVDPHSVLRDVTLFDDGTVAASVMQLHNPPFSSHIFVSRLNDEAVPIPYDVSDSNLRVSTKVGERGIAFFDHSGRSSRLMIYDIDGDVREWFSHPRLKYSSGNGWGPTLRRLGDYFFVTGGPAETSAISHRGGPFVPLGVSGMEVVDYYVAPGGEQFVQTSTTFFRRYGFPILSVIDSSGATKEWLGPHDGTPLYGRFDSAARFRCGGVLAIRRNAHPLGAGIFWAHAIGSPFVPVRNPFPSIQGISMHATMLDGTPSFTSSLYSHPTPLYIVNLDSPESPTIERFVAHAPADSLAASGGLVTWTKRSADGSSRPLVGYVAAGRAGVSRVELEGRDVLAIIGAPEGGKILVAARHRDDGRVEVAQFDQDILPLPTTPVGGIV